MNVFLALLVIFISLRVTTSNYINQHKNRSEKTVISDDYSETLNDLFCDDILLKCKTENEGVMRTLTGLKTKLYWSNDAFCDLISNKCKSEDEVVTKILTNLRLKFYKNLWTSMDNSIRNKNKEVLTLMNEREIRGNYCDGCRNTFVKSLLENVINDYASTPNGHTFNFMKKIPEHFKEKEKSKQEKLLDQLMRHLDYIASRNQMTNN